MPLPYDGPERRVYNGPSDASLSRVIEFLERTAKSSVEPPLTDEDRDTLLDVAGILKDEMPDYADPEEWGEPSIWQDRYLAPCVEEAN